MASQTGSCWIPGEDRSHTVYKLTPEIFKFVQWYSVRVHSGPGPKESQKHHEHKLDSSISRSKRMILEKALCNDWEWFCTFTISEDKYDRKDLAEWWKRFSQWMRDRRKKGHKVRYLLVPEMHQDGSWHAHGFLAGIDPDELISFRKMDAQGYRTPEGRRLPWKLRKKGYVNWMPYQEKFGYCSLGKIKNPTAAAFYVTKYITKDNDRMVKALGMNSYYANQGLNVAQKFVDFFGRDFWIDNLLVNKYEFCATGMSSPRDPLDWELKVLDLAESGPYSDFSLFEPLRFDRGAEDEKTAAETEADDFYECEQLVFAM
ncbi:MAG: hypothetical protein IJZ39_02675 [Oscillospiraceae bacterium]|nr:hypothetical protein [Oscillospiraceae bacterium]